MKYTSDKPTEPGWYWYKPYKSWLGTIVEVKVVGERLSFDGWTVSSYNGLWAGPIEEPEEE